MTLSPYLLPSGAYNKSEIMRRALKRARARMGNERSPRAVLARACSSFNLPPLTFREALSDALRSEWSNAQTARSVRLQDRVTVSPAYWASCATDGRLRVAA